MLPIREMTTLPVRASRAGSGACFGGQVIGQALASA
jgi:acyl-CoA thioesterase